MPTLTDKESDLLTGMIIGLKILQIRAGLSPQKIKDTLNFIVVIGYGFDESNLKENLDYPMDEARKWIDELENKIKEEEEDEGSPCLH